MAAAQFVASFKLRTLSQYIILSTAPTAPVNVRLKKRTSTTLTIIWGKPLLPPATIRVYRVSVWKGAFKEMTTKLGHEVQSVSPIVEYMVDDLEPFTKFQVQIWLMHAFVYTMN